MQSSYESLIIYSKKPESHTRAQLSGAISALGWSERLIDRVVDSPVECDVVHCPDRDSNPGTRSIRNERQADKGAERHHEATLILCGVREDHTDWGSFALADGLLKATKFGQEVCRCEEGDEGKEGKCCVTREEDAGYTSQYDHVVQDLRQVEIVFLADSL